MIHLFLDTNILIDLLANRKPHSKFAIEIFANAATQKCKLYMSSHSFVTTHYILKKFLPETELREILDKILKFIQIIPVEDYMIKRGLKSKISDFEDAIQAQVALSNSKIIGIVTRDIKDFVGLNIPVFAPDEAVLLF